MTFFRPRPFVVERGSPAGCTGLAIELPILNSRLFRSAFMEISIRPSPMVWLMPCLKLFSTKVNRMSGGMRMGSGGIRGEPD
jgi:hypothetical protein